MMITYRNLHTKHANKQTNKKTFFSFLLLLHFLVIFDDKVVAKVDEFEIETSPRNKIKTLKKIHENNFF